mmetsp:Transcript_117737/g.333717  ORF Transcript_117737/g.333717 Transcript_117737/m.333717 type:complete len:553 (-) Transcript_117737:137-1795(-)|eukprot:CAMPEP_0179370404 /NCGR_PEP_ID=MMETSP0797-20121207/85174_1 /TAXON_ID=47934 /ORGANISM="Dinophysis acuminata, Strain DAEP01" /LENGTH=552 /DNA_ID=CAMNT_0021086187 /DNA_START=101 /DNA_END=1759 /DNA_ORIENTATION=+
MSCDGTVAIEPADTTVVAESIEGSKCTKLRTRPRKTNKGRVHWDEQAIAEHDKERGTRQKIDEPDTPFVRSPQTASDSEGGHSSDDEHRRGNQHRASSGSGAPAPLDHGAEAKVNTKGAPSDTRPHASQAEGVGQTTTTANADGVPAETLATRLNLWVQSGGNQRRPSHGSSSLASSDGHAADAECSKISSTCSSRSSSSAPQTRRKQDDLSDSAGGTRRSSERRISLPEDSPNPKPTSDFFKAKRASHYNEVAALKAYKGKDDGDSGSQDSDDSENEQTKTNTNTNINQTISKAVDTRSRASAGDLESGASSERESKERGSVSFPDDDDPGESTEEFRAQRRGHYNREWTEDRSVPATASSLETNTNTNLNAGSSSYRKARRSRAKNPMEAGRPPVQFGEDSLTAATSSSEEFKAQRQEHYDEVAAVRKFRSESMEDEDAIEEEDADEVDPDETSGGAMSSSGGCPVIADATAANPANPMEPRQPGVAFQVAGGIGAIPSSGGTASGADAANAATLRNTRQAHYSGMAAALRNMPPPSDDESDDPEDGTGG